MSNACRQEVVTLVNPMLVGKDKCEETQRDPGTRKGMCEETQMGPRDSKRYVRGYPEGPRDSARTSARRPRGTQGLEKVCARRPRGDLEASQRGPCLSARTGAMLVS
jgi:hypothetical protein